MPIHEVTITLKIKVKRTKEPQTAAFEMVDKVLDDGALQRAIEDRGGRVIDAFAESTSLRRRWTNSDVERLPVRYKDARELLGHAVEEGRAFGVFVALPCACDEPARTVAEAVRRIEGQGGVVHLPMRAGLVVMRQEAGRHDTDAGPLVRNTPYFLAIANVGGNVLACVVEGPARTYCTTFCNRAHRVADGTPVRHQCAVLDPAKLRREALGLPVEGSMRRA